MVLRGVHVVRHQLVQCTLIERASSATGTVTDARTAPAPAAGEWRSLMDRDQWGTLGGGDVPEGWRFEGDVLRREGAAGDIVTREAFGDFELTFQWKAAVAGNITMGDAALASGST